MSGVASDMSESRTHLDILYVGVLPPHPGGAGISWAQLLGGLAALGHTVRALAPITPDTRRNGNADAARHPGIRVARFLMPFFNTKVNLPPPDWYRRLKADRVRTALLGLIGDRRPDLIIIGRESFALYVPDLARAHALPSILGIRGNTTIAIVKGNYPEPLAREMLDQFWKATLLVSCASHMTEGLRTLGFSNVHTIPNAIDTNQFSPGTNGSVLRRRLAIPHDATIVLHASNLKGVKRPLDLVASAAQALQRDRRLIYVIVGDGEFRSAMEETCRRAGVRDRFRFVGWIEYGEMPEYIGFSDLVVMPSESEGLSRVYLETQACGRLLLASDIAPAREVVVDGESGLLFRTGDIDDLTLKTLLAAGNPTLRAEIGRKARERVKAHSLDKAVSAYAAIAKGVIERHFGSIRFGST